MQMSSMTSEQQKELKLALAKDFIKWLNNDLAQIKHPHFSIAFRLKEAKERGFAELLDYTDIYELAEQEFSFKKTSTKNYIAVAQEYMSGSFVNTDWDKYSFTQLVEMLSISATQRQDIKSSWTIKEIRRYKQDHKVVTLPNGEVRLYRDLSPAEKRAYDSKGNDVGQSTDHEARTSPRSVDLLLQVEAIVDKLTQYELDMLYKYLCSKMGIED